MYGIKDSVKYLKAFVFFVFSTGVLAQNNTITGNQGPVVQNEGGSVTIIYGDDGSSEPEAGVPESLRPELSDIAGSIWMGVMSVTDFTIALEFDREFVDKMGRIEYRSRNSGGRVVCSGVLRLSSYIPMFTTGEYRMEQFVDDSSGFPCVSNVIISAMPTAGMMQLTVTDRTSGRTIGGVINQL